MAGSVEAPTSHLKIFGPLVRNRVRLGAEGSNVEIWVIPTNEEIVVAGQTQALLEGVA